MSRCCFYLIKARLAEFNCRLLQTNLEVKIVEPKVCRLIGMASAILNHPLTTPLGTRDDLPKKTLILLLRVDRVHRHKQGNDEHQRKESFCHQPILVP